MTIGHGYGLQTRSVKRMNCLNLGCGWTNKRSDSNINWFNVDGSPLVHPDKVWKAGLENAPFKDNELDYVESVHSFEHFPNHHFALEELYRITRSGGVWKIVVPFGYSWQDNLFHETIGYHYGSFNKFFGNSNRQYYSKVKLRKQRIYAESCGLKRLLPFKKFLSQFFNNIYYQITYELVVIKE
jgi:ubiquinone/menaquinone biosynthesis C-methylase UbiE